MIWVRGLLISALTLTMSPVSAAQGVAGQKIGACGEAASMRPGEIVSAIALSTLGQDYIASQSNDETLLMTRCASGISYYICANEPINERIGGPAILSDAVKGGVIGGLYGMMTGQRGMATAGATAGSLYGAGSEILGVAQCGKERDALMSIAQRARVDWRIFARPGRLMSGQQAARDFDNQLQTAMRSGSISRADYTAINAMFAKWSNWLLR